MTLLVAGILLGIGVPNVMEFQRNGAMTAAANDFVTGVLMARTEAVKRQAPVTLCLSDNPHDATPACSTGRRSRIRTRAASSSGSTRTTTSTPTARAYLTDATDGNAVVDRRRARAHAERVARAARSASRRTAAMSSFAPTGFTRAGRGRCAFRRAPRVRACSATTAAAASPPARSRARAPCASIVPGRASGASRSRGRRHRRSPGHWPASAPTCPCRTQRINDARHRSRQQQRGFGLVESLVALVVMSVGMIGIAALYGQGLGASRTALYRTQAVNLACRHGRPHPRQSPRRRELRRRRGRQQLRPRRRHRLHAGADGRARSVRRGRRRSPHSCRPASATVAVRGDDAADLHDQHHAGRRSASAPITHQIAVRVPNLLSRTHESTQRNTA